MAFAFRRSSAMPRHGEAGAGPSGSAQRDHPAAAGTVAGGPSKAPAASPVRDASASGVRPGAGRGAWPTPGASPRRRSIARIISAPRPFGGGVLPPRLIREATEACAAADEAYRKALYLDPNHDEALVHLALCHERQGDAAGARTLNERARLAGRSGSGMTARAAGRRGDDTGSRRR